MGRPRNPRLGRRRLRSAARGAGSFDGPGGFRDAARQLGPRPAGARARSACGSVGRVRSRPPALARSAVETNRDYLTTGRVATQTDVVYFVTVTTSITGQGCQKINPARRRSVLVVAVVASVRRFFVAGDGAGSGSGRALQGVAGAPRIGSRCAATACPASGAGTPIWGLRCRPQPRAFCRSKVLVQCFAPTMGVSGADRGVDDDMVRHGRAKINTGVETPGGPDADAPTRGLVNMATE